MKLTNEQLKRIIKEELQKVLSEAYNQENIDDMYAKADAAEAAINYDVPQAAKEQIFAKMVARGIAKEGEFAGVEFWEVQPGDYGYDTDMSVEIDGKRYYGEI